MAESATDAVTFAPRATVPLAADFLGGQLTSDGGWAWVAEADAALGLSEVLAASVPDHRHRHGRHTLRDLLRQRLYQIAAGYADQNDADALRTDPLLKLLGGCWARRSMPRRGGTGPGASSSRPKPWLKGPISDSSSPPVLMSRMRSPPDTPIAARARTGSRT